jgi:hypothetical protein
MKLQFIIIFSLLLLSGLNSKSQVNCLNTLKEAKDLYEAGQIDEIPEMLSGCMVSGFTRAQRVEAYKLIIMAYLFDDNQFEAEKTMDEFLKKFPEYEVMPNDPYEFVYLLESYKTSSVYSFNLFLGPTISNQRISEPFSVLDQSTTTNKDKYGSNYQFGFGVSRNIWKDLTANLDFIYSSHSFSQTQQNDFIIDGLPYRVFKLEAKEKLKKIDFPLSFTYNIGKGNLNYFARFGGMVSMVTHSSLTISRSYELPEPAVLPQGDLNIKDLRKKYYYAIIAGAGVQYKVPRGYFVVDLRYYYGLQKMTAESNKYSDYKLWANYNYIDNDFSLDYLTINIGYHFTIYQSRRSRN